MFAPNLLAQADPEVWNAVHLEHRRQDDHVELIASENYVSPAVLIAHGTQLTNKYAEGYPGKRYYGGCEYVDMVETIAIERARKLFGAPWANVQPHSGSQANQAVYAAALRPGDTLLGMSLAHGGHLTHGSPVNYSGKLYKVISYGLTEKEEIDYARAARGPDLRRAGTGEGGQRGGVPRHPGRAADARHRRQGGGVGRGTEAGVQVLPGTRARKRARHGEGVHRAGRTRRFGTHRLPHVPARPAQARHHRQGGRVGARAGAHHAQQERHPRRPAEADGDERRARRHPGDDDARLAQARGRKARPPRLRRARKARRRSEARARRRRGQGALREVSGLRMKCPFCGSADTQVVDT